MNRSLIPTAALLFLFLLLWTSPSQPAERQKEAFRLEERDEVEEVFNLIFGSAPPMATERGILVLEAYHDRNANRIHESEEEELEGEIVCRVDEVAYPLPAFIPGLAYNGSFQVRCSGERFAPLQAEKSIFIKRRGEILRLELPCRAKTSLPENR